MHNNNYLHIALRLKKERESISVLFFSLYFILKVILTHMAFQITPRFLKLFLASNLVFQFYKISFKDYQNYFLRFSCLSFSVWLFFHKLAHNGLRLQEVGDFEALNYLPPMNLIRSTKLQLTTEPPISCRCC